MSAQMGCDAEPASSAFAVLAYLSDAGFATYAAHLVKECICFGEPLT